MRFGLVVRALTIAILVALTGASSAKPVPPPDPPPPSQPAQVARPSQTIACDECVRGDQELTALGHPGNTLRANADLLVARWVPLHITSGPIDEGQQRELQVVLHERADLRDAIAALDAVSDVQLLAIGHALCKSPDRECAQSLAGALRSARHVAELEVPAPYGLPPEPLTCDPTVGRVRSPKAGLGLEYASGWQGSARPVDGRAWSVGLAARARLTGVLGIVARIDRSSGRDEADDADGDGHDDTETGAVTRWSLLAGPSLILHVHRDRQASRYWQVDGLVGLSRSGDQSGPITAYDLSYQLVVARVGVRFVQGFGDASEERAALLHAGLQFGAGPQYSYAAGCPSVEHRARGSAWAAAMDIPLSGWATDIGYVTPSFGLEALLHLHHRFDALLRADLLDMPSGDRDRALHSSALAGGRVDLSSDHAAERFGWFATIAAGYDHVATTTSAPIQSGAVADASLGLGIQASDGAAYLRLHGRFGLTDDNRDLRAVFLSFGLEWRLDRSRWSDRN